MAELIKSANFDEEKQAKLEIWSYALGFTPTAVVKCTIELGIVDVIETNGGTMTHADLSAAVGCSPPVLRRIMRYLVHRRFFKQTLTPEGQKPPIISYAQTPLSRQLLRNSMAALVLLESNPIMLAPWQRLSSRAREKDGKPFAEEHGRDLWEYTNANPAHSKLFDDGMSCIATAATAAILDQYPEAFDGITSLVDVGGGDGTTLRILVKACPWIRGVNFDLAHVVSFAPPCEGVEHVAGDMFDVIPKADAAFLMSVLHDWNDEECISILRKCKEAIPMDRGKAIIVDAVIREEEEEDDKYSDVRMAMDMVMLAHTSGKERTLEEWEYVLNGAGFSRFTVKHIEAIQPLFWPIHDSILHYNIARPTMSIMQTNHICLREKKLRQRIERESNFCIKEFVNLHATRTCSII